MKKTIASVLMFLCVGAAQAQLTGNVSVVTDYRFRGVSQTHNSLALQGGIDYTDKSGFYIGNWNSNVSSRIYTDSIGLENDVYAGFKKQVFKDVVVDVGVYSYFFSQADKKFSSSSNTQEGYIGVTTGPVTLKYSRSLSNYFGAVDSRGSQYLQADLVYPVAKNFKVDAHYGRTLVNNHPNSRYDDLKVGVSYLVFGLNVGAHYYNNYNSPLLANTNTIVFSVGKSF